MRAWRSSPGQPPSRPGSRTSSCGRAGAEEDITGVTAPFTPLPGRRLSGIIRTGATIMHAFARRLFGALLILASAEAASGQTADEIIEKHLAAVGGRAALAKLKSRSMTGTITLTTPAGDVSGPIEVLNAAPNKSRTLIKLDLSAFGAGEMTVDQRFNGASGYVIDTLQGNRDITGSQLENMRNGAFPNTLVNYKQRGLSVELAGKEKIGDREAYVLILKPATGPVARQFIEAETFLQARVVVKIDLPQV